MAITIDAGIEGEVQLQRKLLVVADGVKDFKEPLRRIEEEVLKSFQDNFDARGGLFGGWPPAKKDYGHPLLEDSGAMRSNFQSRIGKDFVRLYNPTSYFVYHQSNAPRSKLPRRVMMKLDQQRKTFIVKAFQEHIVALLRARS